jgi:hypothetical protein
MAYNIRIPSRSAGNAIPSSLTTLSISWLNKQFKAVSIHRGLVDGTWERPDPIEGTSHFESLLKEAIQNTGFRGQTVTLVLGHQRLVQQPLDLPPVKGTALAKLVQRQAAQQKVFQGEAAWAFETANSPKGMQRVILHLFPRILLGQLVNACRKFDLHLRAVMPPSAVVHHQLSQLPGAKDEVDLLAAETGGSTTVVISRNDGQMVLARTLPCSWTEDVERTAVDLNRTMLFASQQYGVTIKKEIWIFGPGARENLLALQTKLQLLVKASPADDTPFYWATEAAKLRPSAVPNFISAEQQKAPQRRVFAKVVAAGTVVVMVASLAATGYAFFQARQERETARSLQEQLFKLENRRKDLQLKVYEWQRRQQISTLIVDQTPAPVPVWLLAYLSEAVPNDLVLTNLHVARSNDVWRVQIAGSVLELPGTTNAPASEASIELFRSSLSKGPLKLELKNEGAATNRPPASAATRPPLTQELFNRPRGVLGEEPEVRPALTQFLIEGVMR